MYSDILHFQPKTEQHPPSYDDIEPSIPSVTIILPNIQDDDIILPYYQIFLLIILVSYYCITYIYHSLNAMYITYRYI